MGQGELGRGMADRRRHSYRLAAVGERDFEGSRAPIDAEFCVKWDTCISFGQRKGIRAPNNSFSIWLFLLINSLSVVQQTMRIDPSAHRTSFISATGVSANATFLSALPLVLWGGVTVFPFSVEYLNLHAYCMSGSGYMVHMPYIFLLYISSRLYPFKCLIGWHKINRR